MQNYVFYFTSDIKKLFEQKFEIANLLISPLIIYRKNSLIHPGRIYGQRGNSMSLNSGWGGFYVEELIFGRKNTPTCNLLNLLLFFLFSKFFNNQQPQMVRIKSI